MAASKARQNELSDKPDMNECDQLQNYLKASLINLLLRKDLQELDTRKVWKQIQTLLSRVRRAAQVNVVPKS